MRLNPSTAMAKVIVDELIRGGVEEFVLAPGSRNAPLSLAVAEAADLGRARLHVRIDERTAGFLALGLAKGSGRAVAVITTSGTAAANLHPAVLEAAHSDLPLMVLTADRPPELRGTGANQTTDQYALFGKAVRYFAELGPAEPIVGQVSYWRSAVARAVHSSANGPVHLNIALREPLVSEGGEWIEALDGRDGDLPWTMVVDHLPHTFEIGLDLPPRGVVVVAHDPMGIPPAQIEAFAGHHGWPLVAENPLSFPSSISHASLFLASSATRETLRPDVVLVVGRPVLSRSLAALIKDVARVIVIDPSHTWSDPWRSADLVLPDLPMREESADIDSTWLPLWRDVSKRSADVISQLPEWSSGRISAHLAASFPSQATVFVGASRPIRDLEAFASARSGVNVFANRGLAGIDGNISTAVGIALTSADPAYAVVGDLTFLHDLNGLLVNDHMPSLTVIVMDNNGGGIFSSLPQAGQPNFERVFGTPHDRDLVAIARSFNVDTASVTSLAELDAQLAIRSTGIRVLVISLPTREEGAQTLELLLQRLTD
jgi:2-succinyl-5-enolpyruvyl-6-hydroxy-3-cyclohexene-1-carboxylate synthase